MRIAIDHHTGHIKCKNNVQNTTAFNSTTPQFSQYNLAPALPKYCKSPVHSNGPRMAGSTQNWMIQSALASLRGLDAQEKTFDNRF